jgi:DNA-binding CsgD family transcriptional regulator
MAGDCDFAIELGEGTPEILLGRSRTEVLRIVGEALTNARRHANAHKIRLRTWLSNGRLFLEISDDGCGFDYDRADGDAGAGLVGLRERADLIDATLTVTSSPGSGTRIEIGVPLRDESEEPQRIRVLLVEDRRSLELLRFAGERRERDLGERDLAAQLTAREREVLQGLADGLDSQALAERLHISVRTERNHVANILGKLGVHSRLQALVAAVRLGVVSIR